MISHPSTNIRALPAQHKALLAQLLCFCPGYPINSDASWLHSQAQLLSTLPPTLLRPRALFSCLRPIALPFSSPRATLCSVHKRLNPGLIHSIFLEITTECTSHLERFLEFFNSDLELPAALKELVRKQQPFVKRMQAINGLWMTPRFYRSLFGPWHATPSDFCFERVDSGCEACILASIGGNHVVLSDLRASIRGRKKRGHSQAAVLEIVEAWIDSTGRGDQIREDSSGLGKELARCRREMQKMRRLKRRGLRDDVVLKPDQELEDESEGLWSSGSSKEDEVREKDDDNDFEGSIIDFYAKRMSAASPINRVRTADGLHPAFSESIVCNPLDGTFCRVELAGQKSHCPIDSYTESDYNEKDAERYAASYQKLLAMTEDWNAESDSESSVTSTFRAKEPLFNFF